jgi:hypothetical protein
MGAMSDGKGRLGKVGSKEGKKKKSLRLTDTLANARQCRDLLLTKRLAVRERESKALGCHRCAPVHACSDATRVK